MGKGREGGVTIQQNYVQGYCRVCIWCITEHGCVSSLFPSFFCHFSFVLHFSTAVAYGRRLLSFGEYQRAEHGMEQLDMVNLGMG